MEFDSIWRGVLGLGVLVGVAYAISTKRRAVDWKLVGTGVGLQIVFAVFFIKGERMGEAFAPLAWPKEAFEWASGFFILLVDFSREGAQFVFGRLALSTENEASLGVFFAFQVLPVIIFFASLMATLYHYGVMQRLVSGMAWVMRKTMKIGGAESLAVAANVFVGHTEAPLVVKPYLKRLTESELATVMIGGMATIAGSVMAAYIAMLGPAYAEATGKALDEAQRLFAAHLLGASVISAPAAVVVAKLMFPETETPETAGDSKTIVERTAANGVEAAANGASEGVTLALNVGGMIIAFIGVIYMLNHFLFHIGEFLAVNEALQASYGTTLSFQFLIGYPLQLVAYGIGVPWQDALEFGSLFGIKVALNEFVAYLDMAQMIKSGALASDKSVFMATYAICGFANFGSLAIQLGGLGPLAPSRKPDVARLGMKSVVGGSLATLMTAAVAGMFY